MRMYFVIPCYNEESSVSDTAEALKNIICNLKNEGLIKSGKILFVDDASTDNTYFLAEKSAEVIRLFENCGQQRAICEGLLYALGKCDFVITLDCDLQDDVECIYEMVRLYNEGAKVVYGVRKSRKADSFTKRISAEAFYFIMKIVNPKTIKNHGDFRLMDSTVIKKALKNTGKYPYLRGLIPRLGFFGKCIYYDRKQRKKGKSKYTFKKMLGLAKCGFYTAFTKIR